MENIERRTIRSYTRRERTLSDAQKKHYEELFALHAIPADDARLTESDLHPLFNNENTEKNRDTIILDIGFGYGESLIALAKEQNNTNFLGVEVNKHCIFRCLRTIEEEGIQNIKLIHNDAMELVLGVFAAQSFSALHIFFPDPWRKKRHHKRRFIQSSSIPLLAKILKDDGYLYFVSDWLDYVEHTKTLLDASPLFIKKSDKQAKWWKTCAYERKAENVGRASHHLLYRKANTP